QSEDIKKVGGDTRGRGGLRRRTGVYTNDRSAPSSTGDIFENLAPKLAEPRSRVVAQIQRCRTRAIFIQGFVNPNESFRIREGQRAQEHAFDDGEDRS